MNLLKLLAVVDIGAIGIASVALGVGILIISLLDPVDRGLTLLYASAVIVLGSLIFLAIIKKLRRQPLYLLVSLSIPLAFLVMLIPEWLGYDFCCLNHVLFYIWSFGMLFGLPLLSYKLIRRYYAKKN
jgi:hypothetical protein